MPTVRITLTDTPTGGVEAHTEFDPAPGTPCTPAQALALEICNAPSVEVVHINQIPPELPQ